MPMKKEQQALNAVVKFPGVARNLESDVKNLKQRVEDTFQGPPAAVLEKQKSSSKWMFGLIQALYFVAVDVEPTG